MSLEGAKKYTFFSGVEEMLPDLGKKGNLVFRTSLSLSVYGEFLNLTPHLILLSLILHLIYFKKIYIQQLTGKKHTHTQKNKKNPKPNTVEETLDTDMEALALVCQSVLLLSYFVLARGVL